MSWPLSQDYNEAVQNPRSNFSDPDLQWGEVVTTPLGIPLPRSGNFADVYELRCPGGDRWAVKCFTREIHGLRERYAAISRHLQDANLPFTVDFTFLEQGIRVGSRWYPVLKMEWVEGLTLNEFVRQYADKPAMLEALLQIWLRMATRLRGAGIAHADLQHGNVLLVPSGTSNSLAVKLVDYDGMFVPALAGGDSGEVGHPCYQHPQRLTERTYSLEVDRFPLLLVATTLHAVKVGGRALWEKYDSGDNLLFREADLRSPVKSPLFYELLKLADARASRLAGQTLDALKGRLESVPLLEEALPELHVVAAPKPAPAPALPKRTAVKVATTEPAAESAATGSVWDFEGEEKVRLRRRRKGGLGRWVGIAAAVLVAAAIVGGGVFALVFWQGLQKPKNVTPIAENRPERPTQVPDEPKEKPDANGQDANGSNPPVPDQLKPPVEVKEPLENATPPQPKGNSLPADASIADLRQALKNEDPAVQERAATLLSKLGPKAEPAMYDLADTLTNEKNPTKVRTFAALAIAHIGSAAKPVVPALVKAIQPSQPLEVRQSAAEAFGQMKYPATEEGLPAILSAIETDTDPLVRQKCVWSLFPMSREAMEKTKADKVLEKVLDGTEGDMILVRYDAARKLAVCLGSNAPDKTTTVLLHMLTNKKLPIDKSTEAKMEGAGKVNVQANTGGDTRYMAVQTLGLLGEKAVRNPGVVKALREAATEKDPGLSTPARKLLSDFNIEIKEPPAIATSPEPPKVTPPEPPKVVAKDGFVSLFNGKDLTGWKPHPDDKTKWEVKDGILIGSGERGHLFSERGDYDNFHYRVEAMINDRGNSGQYFRSEFGPGFPKGYMAQIDANSGNRQKTGSLYGIVKVAEQLHKPDEWFTQEVIAEGDHILIKVNDKTVVDTHDSRYKKGHFVLQQHDPATVIKFRKIEVKLVKVEISRNDPVSPPRRVEDNLPPEVKAAKAFEKSREDARAKLLAEFDAALDRLAKSNASTDRRLKLIDAVKEEKNRFENRGLIPWSEPMRPAIVKYFASTSAAESKVQRVYKSLIDAQLKAKKESAVAGLRADLSNLLGTQIVGRWRYFLNDRPVGIHSLYSNGRIGRADGNSTWFYAKGVLIFRFPNAKAPGGAWVDTLQVSADGTICAGTNNDSANRRPQLKGVYVKDN